MSEKPFIGSLILASSVAFVFSALEFAVIPTINLVLTILVLVAALFTFSSYAASKKFIHLALIFFLIAILYNGILLLSSVSGFLVSFLTIINILGLVTLLTLGPSKQTTQVVKTEIIPSPPPKVKKELASKAPAKKKSTKKKTTKKKTSKRSKKKSKRKKR